MVAERTGVSPRIRVEGKKGEERFLDCADQLLRRSEVEGKSRSAPLGMTRNLGVEGSKERRRDWRVEGVQGGGPWRQLLGRCGSTGAEAESPRRDGRGGQGKGVAYEKRG